MSLLEDSGLQGAVVVVGVKLDLRSRELLTWALLNVARTRDRLVALHVLHSQADKQSLVSLVKMFDSMLAAYEGFCNLKQVAIKLKVCRGSPVRKILAKEAKSCGATSLIVGTSGVHHTIQSEISVAKYCAKKLEKNISVICVDNGKIVLERESTSSTAPAFGSLDVSASRFKMRKTLLYSSLSQPPLRVLSSSNSGSESVSMGPIKTQEMPKSKSRWALLHSLLFESSSTKNLSGMQLVLKQSNRQSIAAISSEKKQVSASDRDDCRFDLDQEKDAIALFSSDSKPVAHSLKISSGELKGLAEKYATACQLFSYQELFLATNNFQPENLIGEGGSSNVYRGRLPGGKDVAVKILKPSEDVVQHFVSEIDITMSLHHKNIIALVGFCFEEDTLILVYDFLSRGSLEENLHGNEKPGNLFNWEQRCKVALGVAKALDHLHNSAESIIHRDVKSSNILLSIDFEPQLSDFGLATWASRWSLQIGSSDVAGTFGYLAPEYFMHGKLNKKIDVYAFGVVLLELLSGRKAIDNGHPKGKESLVMWANYILKEGKVSELQDPDLVNACDHDHFEKLFLAAMLCIRRAPQSRPEIRLVLKLLQRDPEVIEWARQEMNSNKDVNSINDGQSATHIQSFINLALLNLEDDSASISSADHNISVDDYLGDRCSRSSSFN